MSEDAKNQLQELRHNKVGLATIVGVAFFVAYGAAASADLLLGLVLATVYGSGLNAGRVILKRLTEAGHGDALPAKIIAAIAVGIVTGLIISLVQGTGLVTPMEDDNIIVTIIKRFFDNNAAFALGIGALVGMHVHQTDSD